jgi:MFS transporter, ACS family, tartrate transporter
LSDLTGSFRPGMWLVAGFLLLAAVVTLAIARRVGAERR